MYWAGDGTARDRRRGEPRRGRRRAGAAADFDRTSERGDGVARWQQHRDGETGGPLERWIRQELETVYRDVLESPLPPEMTELLARWEMQTRPTESDDGKDGG